MSGLEELREIYRGTDKEKAIERRIRNREKVAKEIAEHGFSRMWIVRSAEAQHVSLSHLSPEELPRPAMDTPTQELER